MYDGPWLGPQPQFPCFMWHPSLTSLCRKNSVIFPSSPRKCTLELKIHLNQPEFSSYILVRSKNKQLCRFTFTRSKIWLKQNYFSQVPIRRPVSRNPEIPEWLKVGAFSWGSPFSIKGGARELSPPLIIAKK